MLYHVFMIKSEVVKGSTQTIGNVKGNLRNIVKFKVHKYTVRDNAEYLKEPRDFN